MPRKWYIASTLLVAVVATLMVAAVLPHSATADKGPAGPPPGWDEVVEESGPVEDEVVSVEPDDEPYDSTPPATLEPPKQADPQPQPEPPVQPESPTPDKKEVSASEPSPTSPPAVTEPKTQVPKPVQPVPAPTTPVPPPPKPCPYPLSGKDGQPGNDDCVKPLLSGEPARIALCRPGEYKTWNAPEVPALLKQGWTPAIYVQGIGTACSLRDLNVDPAQYFLDRSVVYTDGGVECKAETALAVCGDSAVHPFYREK